LKVCWARFVEEVQNQGSQAHKVAQKYYSKSRKRKRRYFERGAKINRRVELIEDRKMGGTNNIVMGPTSRKDK
jgi:hypothetical protein